MPALKVTQMRWNLPPNNWLKYNMDGVSRGNPGRISYAFCIRDPLGDLIYAEAKEIAEGTNTFLEIIAILEAARYCVAHNVFNLILETDSLFLKNIITGTWKPPWSVTAELEEIGELLENLNIQVTHVMSEDNQLVDYLANSALERGDIIVHLFNELDSQGRKIINSDKFQCPYLRVRAARKG
ncbi:hypothetical protein P3S67_027512 [Capsicum chacoense]